MCGIAGMYVRAGERAASDPLLAMGGELRHRGPDGTGLYLDRRFGMVNTRLSIIDLEGGDQPLSDERGRFWVMQNGEIYNHPELRAELERRGHRFATRSDTEVLAHGYEEWGAALLERLNGEFAFALWDRKATELLLARDRFGIRPLFLAEAGGAFCFASEAKALLRLAALPRALDPLGLVESFTLWATSPERSAFVGIRELPAGHYLRLGPDGEREQRRWWDLPLAEPGDMLPGSEAALAEELAALLQEATRIRLRADVPVGMYLSGGLDSSAVTALARRLSPHPVRAFAIGFADRRFDETPFQDRAARALGTTLSRVTVTGPEIAALLPRAVALMEKPTLRTAPAPLLRLSGLVRESGFKVVLTGEGADELFAGYDVFQLDAVRRFWARDPESRLRPLLLRRLYAYLGLDLRRAGTLLAGAFRHGLTATEDPLYSHRPRFEKAARCLGFFSRDLLERAREQGDAAAALVERLPERFHRWSGLKKAQYLEVQTFLSGYLLHSQGDRMLMGSSVEGRFPFLDYRVAEFAARLPDPLQLRGLREKHLLRKAVGPLLPPEITRREKRPYRAPIVPALLGPGAPEYVAELTRPEKVAEAGVLSPAAVARLLEKCRRNADGVVGETDEMALVGVLSVLLLHEQMVARPTRADSAVPTRVVVGATVLPLPFTPESIHEHAATTTPA